MRSLHLFTPGVFKGTRRKKYSVLTNKGNSNTPSAKSVSVRKNIPKRQTFVRTRHKKHRGFSLKCHLSLYIHVFENIPNEKNGNFYHWFINKKTNANTVIQQPQNISPDSYLYSPQILTADNELYFIGYPLEKEDDVANINENPSVIVLSVSDFQ